MAATPRSTGVSRSLGVVARHPSLGLLQKAPPPPATPAVVIGLDLTVDAPQQVFVRGRGLDAEAGGELHVAGTTAAPQVSGGFEMRHGKFDLGGISLKFTSGKVSFNGTGLTQKIDPTLDFEAASTSGGITAKLAVTGYADAPKIKLTSVPDLPQDEILARLLLLVLSPERFLQTHLPLYMPDIE